MKIIPSNLVSQMAIMHLHPNKHVGQSILGPKSYIDSRNTQRERSGKSEDETCREAHIVRSIDFTPNPTVPNPTHDCSTTGTSSVNLSIPVPVGRSNSFWLGWLAMKAAKQ